MISYDSTIQDIIRRLAVDGGDSRIPLDPFELANTFGLQITKDLNKLLTVDVLIEGRSHTDEERIPNKLRRFVLSSQGWAEVEPSF